VRRTARGSRSLVFVFVCLSLCLALFACKASGPAGGAGEHPFKVALLNPGPISDAGWNAAGYEGLLRIRDELGAQVSNMQTSTPSQFEEGFRDYARQGYDLVFGHGFEFQDAALKVGAEFPNTVFVTSSGSVYAKNVASLTIHLEQATYLAGMLAGGMSKTHRAGCVGGIELPVIRIGFDGFTAGARSMQPDFVVATAFTGSFEDVAAAKAATDAMIAQGADMVLHNADAAGLGVFQSATSHGIFAFGTNRDQSDVAPATVLASATVSLPEAFIDVAREVKEHRFVGRAMQLGMAEGVVRLAVNPKLKDRIPADLWSRVSAAQEKIARGELRVLP